MLKLLAILCVLFSFSCRNVSTKESASERSAAVTAEDALQLEPAGISNLASIKDPELVGVNLTLSDTPTDNVLSLSSAAKCSVKWLENSNFKSFIRPVKIQLIARNNKKAIILSENISGTIPSDVKWSGSAESFAAFKFLEAQDEIQLYCRFVFIDEFGKEQSAQNLEKKVIRLAALTAVSDSAKAADASSKPDLTLSCSKDLVDAAPGLAFSPIICSAAKPSPSSSVKFETTSLCPGVQLSSAGTISGIPLTSSCDFKVVAKQGSFVGDEKTIQVRWHNATRTYAKVVACENTNFRTLAFTKTGIGLTCTDQVTFDRGISWKSWYGFFGFSMFHKYVASGTESLAIVEQGDTSSPNAYIFQRPHIDGLRAQQVTLRNVLPDYPSNGRNLLGLDINGDTLGLFYISFEDSKPKFATTHVSNPSTWPKRCESQSSNVISAKINAAWFIDESHYFIGSEDGKSYLCELDANDPALDRVSALIPNQVLSAVKFKDNYFILAKVDVDSVARTKLLVLNSDFTTNAQKSVDPSAASDASKIQSQLYTAGNLSPWCWSVRSSVEVLGSALYFDPSCNSQNGVFISFDGLSWMDIPRAAQKIGNGKDMGTGSSLRIEGNRYEESYYAP